MSDGLKVLIALIGIPFAIIGCMFLYIAVDRATCETNVTQELARHLIEQRLAEPRSSAVIRGRLPIIDQIDPYPMNNPEIPGGQGFKFRLRGSGEGEWWFAWFDHCGYFELAGPQTHN